MGGLAVGDAGQLPGWTWEGSRPQQAGSAQERFARAVRAVQDYAAAHGTCDVPTGTRAPDGLDLRRWVTGRRTDYRRGTLAADRIAALEAVPGWHW